MNKRSLLAIAAFAAMAGAASAATLTIGSGAGSLTNVSVNDSGYVLGDTATFNNGTVNGTTIWKLYFGVAEGSNVVYVDTEAATTTDIGAGSPSSTATTLTNNGRALTPIPNMTADLSVNLSQPTIGSNTNVAQLDFAWTLADTSGSARTVTITGWLDADLYVGGTFSDNVIAFASGAVSGYSIGNPLGAIGMSNGPGSVDLDKGVLFDAITPGGVTTSDVTLVGIANGPGASFWWTSGAPYATSGYGVNNGTVDSSLANKIEGDAGNDYLIDAGTDIGGAIAVDVTVPANGTATVTYRLLYGLDTTLNGSTFTPPSSVTNWTLYQN